MNAKCRKSMCHGSDLKSPGIWLVQNWCLFSSALFPCQPLDLWAGDLRKFALWFLETSEKMTCEAKLNQRRAIWSEFMDPAVDLLRNFPSHSELLKSTGRDLPMFGESLVWQGHDSYAFQAQTKSHTDRKWNFTLHDTFEVSMQSRTK